MHNQKIVLTVLQKNILELYSEFGFSQRKMPLFRQFSYALQFFFIFTFKLSLFPRSYNETIYDTSNAVVDFMANQIVSAILNFVVIIPIIFFIIWNTLQMKQESRHQLHSGIFTSHNLKILAINSMFVLQLASVPCLTTNVRTFYLAISDPVNHLNIGLLILKIFSLCFACLSTILNNYAMLLSYLTIPVTLCLLGPQWNVMVVTIPGLLLVVSRLQFNGYFGSSSNRVASTFKFMLVFVFTLDVLTPSISNAFFTLYAFIITMIPIVSPEPQFIANNIEFNIVLLNILDKMKKKETIPKVTQFKVVKQIFKYQDAQKSSKQSNIQKLHPTFQLVNPITYSNLLQFFKAKIAEDMERQKNENTYKLQHYLFKIKHDDMPLDVLQEITEFSQATRYTFDIHTKILLLQVQHQIDKLFKKRDGIYNLNRIIDVCTKIDLSNDKLDVVLKQITKFWTMLFKKQLNIQEVFQSLNVVEEKEKYVINTLKYLEKFPSLSSQTQLYNYSLNLFNFDYTFEQQQNNALSFKDLTSTCYVIMTQFKIVDVSNQMLLELRKKKSQTVGRSLEALIPMEIVELIETRIKEIFISNKVEKRVIPILDIRNQVVPYRVDIETIFSLESGTQQLINFLKSDDLRELPVFFYQPSTGKILFTSQLFIFYARNYHIRISSNTLGVDLFGSQFSSMLSTNYQKINESFSCVLKQDQAIITETINIRILDFFEDKHSKYLLLAIDSNEKIASLVETTIFSMTAFVKKKNQQKIDSFGSYEEIIKIIKSSSEVSPTFCPILNPYETHIDQSMTKIKIDCRMTYLRASCILMSLIICLMIATMMIIAVKANDMNSQVQKQFDNSAKKANAIESAYEMLYLYYRYYQIKNYPEQMLNIADYNISQLTDQYYNLTCLNLTIVIQLTIQPHPMRQKNYTMQYKHFNLTKTTTRESVIDFLTDIKYALNSNNPYFSVKNQPNLDIIVSAYQQNSFLFFNRQKTILFYSIVVAVSLYICLAISLKILTFKIEQLSSDVMELYENIPQKVIKDQLKKYEQLKKVIQYSDPLINKYSQKEDQLKSSKNKQKGNQRIKRKSVVSFIMSNNMILALCLGTLVFIFWMQISLNSYEANINAVLNKQQYLQNLLINILIPAQRFYQAAMEQILPLSQKNPRIKPPVEHLSTDHSVYNLPSYFKEYQTLENKVLQASICQYNYLNTNQIYLKLNCSVVLNGIMEKTFSQAFSQLKSLVRNYTGVGMKKLGQTYRIGAIYPVFMEVCYLRRNLNVVINYLSKEFESKLPGFVESQTQQIKSILYVALITMPIFIVFFILEYNRLRNQANATIRAFKMIPKEYLLKMSITKFIKNEKLLNKMQAF